MAMRPEDTAGVIAPPPLLFAGTLAICVALDLAVLHAATGIAQPWRFGAGGVCAAAAAVLFVGAQGKFRRARTPVAPWLPTTAIVTTGVYGFSRNPIYVAMTLLYAAIALAADSGFALLALVPLLLVIRYGVIGREERYLAREFGADYAAYRSRVRRWV